VKKETPLIEQPPQCFRCRREIPGRDWFACTMADCFGRRFVCHACRDHLKKNAPPVVEPGSLFP
jgi:hypothetical protein